jgi:hypothetical protein
VSFFADELTGDFFNRLELFMAGGERKFMSDSHKMDSHCFWGTHFYVS